jgi:hypothetical protein
MPKQVEKKYDEVETAPSVHPDEVRDDTDLVTAPMAAKESAGAFAFLIPLDTRRNEVMNRGECGNRVLI